METPDRKHSKTVADLLLSLHCKKSYKSAVAIYTSDNNKMPTNQFMVCINMPEVVGSFHIVHSSLKCTFCFSCMPVSSSVYRASRSLHRCTRNPLCFSSCITMFSPQKGNSFTVFPTSRKRTSSLMSEKFSTYKLNCCILR